MARPVVIAAAFQWEACTAKRSFNVETAFQEIVRKLVVVKAQLSDRAPSHSRTHSPIPGASFLEKERLMEQVLHARPKEMPVTIRTKMSIFQAPRDTIPSRIHSNFIMSQEVRKT